MFEEILQCIHGLDYDACKFCYKKSIATIENELINSKEYHNTHIAEYKSNSPINLEQHNEYDYDFDIDYDIGND